MSKVKNIPKLEGFAEYKRHEEKRLFDSVRKLVSIC